MTVEIGSAGPAIRVLMAAGRLSRATIATLRNAAEKALAEQPDLLVIDLSRVVLVDRLAVRVLPAITDRAAAWPSTRVAVAGAARDVQRELRLPGGIGTIVWFSDLDAAIAAGTAPPGPTLIRMRLPEQACAGAMARAAIAGLRVGGIRDRAEVVATELVNNAVQHARAPLELRLHHATRLHISVRDGEPSLVPRAGAGYGLDIVRRFATTWSWRPIAGGKVVWAVVVPRPPRRPSVRLTCAQSDE
jgi:ABC-type transporter Mla MlaB component